MTEASPPLAGPTARALGWAYERAPAGLDGLLAFGRRYVLPLLRHRLEVLRLTGPAGPSGASATLVTVGQASSLGYLTDRFFAAAPTVERLAPVALADLPRALDRLAAEADLVVAGAPRAYAGWLGPGCLRVPALVDFRLAIAADLAATLAPASQTVRHDARRAAEAGYGWRASGAPGDLDRFDHEFHRPFVLAQHGPRAVLRAPATLRRTMRHGGQLLWIRHGDRDVAGALVRRRGRCLHLLVEGVSAEARRLRDPSPQFAVKLAAVQHAHATAAAALHLGGTAPDLRNGAFRAKRAWGGTARLWEESHRELLLRWRAPNAAVRALLRAAPLLFVGPRGLWAVTAADPARGSPAAAALGLWRQLAPAGVEGLVALGAADAPLAVGPLRLCPDGDPAAVNRFAA